MDKQKQVFISATKADRPLVRVLEEKLRAAGFEPWTVDKIKTGGNILNAITVAMRSSRALIILLTPHSIQDSYMLVEAGAAWGSDKPIIPVLAGVSAREIPTPLKELQAVSFDRFESAVRQLERELALPA